MILSGVVSKFNAEFCGLGDHCAVDGRPRRGRGPTDVFVQPRRLRFSPSNAEKRAVGPRVGTVEGQIVVFGTFNRLYEGRTQHSLAGRAGAAVCARVRQFRGDQRRSRFFRPG